MCTKWIMGVEARVFRIRMDGPGGSSLNDLLEKRRRSVLLIQPHKRSSRTSLSSFARRNSKFALFDGGGNSFGSSAPNGSVRSVEPKKRPESFLQKLPIYLQCAYEKSRIHSLFPVIILVAYSFLGGLIFYSIESPNEATLLNDKKRYIDDEKDALFRIILEIEERVKLIRSDSGNTRRANVHLRHFKRFALNRLNKAVYWYTLSVYYLTDHESYKASALHPESPEEIWQKHFATNFGRIYALRNYTEQLSQRCWEIGMELNENSQKSRKKMDEALALFDGWTGLSHVLSPTWTFWNSMFLAVTTYTTIGYGNITAKTRLGKLAAMLYAVIGIPLVLMILHKLGRQCLRALEYLWDYLVRAMEYLWCVEGTARLKKEVSEDATREASMPLLLAVGIASGWMFLCAAIFLKFEKDWDYFKSFYFFFCSLTTIGYGDVTPTNSEDMFIIFGFIIVGLSLVSMCINVVQLKLEQLFEELLLMMMEEYRQTGLESPDMKGKMGMLAIWRMWRKKRRQEKEKQKKPKEFLIKTRTFPFKYGRQALVEQIHRALHMVSRGTQTDDIIFASHLGVLREYEDSHDWSPLLPLSNPNTEHLMCLGTVSFEDNLSQKPLVVRERDRLHMHSMYGQPNASSNSSTSAASSAKSSTDKNSVVTFSSSGSVQSAATYSGRRSSFAPENFDPSRRWTFVETGKAPRGAPRGLVVPSMYTSDRSKNVYTNDLRRLIAEIDVRLQDCRTLAAPSDTPCSSSRSQSNK